MWFGQREQSSSSPRNLQLSLRLAGRPSQVWVAREVWAALTWWISGETRARPRRPTTPGPPPPRTPSCPQRLPCRPLPPRPAPAGRCWATWGPRPPSWRSGTVTVLTARQHWRAAGPRATSPWPAPAPIWLTPLEPTLSSSRQRWTDDLAATETPILTAVRSSATQWRAGWCLTWAATGSLSVREIWFLTTQTLQVSLSLISLNIINWIEL